MREITWYIKRLFIMLTVLILVGSSPALAEPGDGGDNGPDASDQIELKATLTPPPGSPFPSAKGQAQFREVDGEREIFIKVQGLAPGVVAVWVSRKGTGEPWMSTMKINNKGEGQLKFRDRNNNLPSMNDGALVEIIDLGGIILLSGNFHTK